MKIRKLMTLSSLMLAFFLSTAFMSPEKPVQKETEKGGETFAEFLSHFEKTDLPFAIGLSEFRKRSVVFENQKKAKLEKAKMKKTFFRSKYIPESSASFSRMGPPNIEPVARFYPTEKMIAVIYEVQSRFAEANQQYSMLIYDLKGNIVFPKMEDGLGMSHHLAHLNSQEAMTCSIDRQGHIQQNTYTHNFKKQKKKTSFEADEFANYELSSSELFKINVTGTIVQVKDNLADNRASLD